tara:strand:+ start:3926 stop:4306 length:381 start_codon:yes stop_codon:yes gene_type:complete
LYSLFKRRRPEGRFKIAHPLREPARAVGQSFMLWPAVALAAIMYAAPRAGVEKPTIVVLFLQVTVLYPIIAGAAFAAWFGLARSGREQLALLPLVIPLAIVGVWFVAGLLFAARFLVSLLGYWTGA